MESSSGSKELAATAAGAAASRPSRPPARELEKAINAAKPASDGEPSSAIIPGGNGKWKKSWREGSKDAQGTPLGKLIIDGSVSLVAAPAHIHKYSSETERTVALIPEKVRNRIEAAMDKKDLKVYLEQIRPCPFTDAEIGALENERDSEDPSKPREMLVFLPKDLSPTALHLMWGLESNMNFSVDRLVRTTMKKVDQWFITATASVPEMLDAVGKMMVEEYGKFRSGEQTLHGMDIRRYIAFAGYHLDLFGKLPDFKYWNFLWGSTYDSSGILVSGFDEHGVLSSHGWMKNWRAKYAGTRYIVLPPREEINSATEHLERVQYHPDKNRLIQRMKSQTDRLMQERQEREGRRREKGAAGEDSDESGSIE